MSRCTMASLGGLFLASRITSVSQSSGSGILLLESPSRRRSSAARACSAAMAGPGARCWHPGHPVDRLRHGPAEHPTAVQFMIIGGVLLAAVVLDSLSRRSQKTRGRA